MLRCLLLPHSSPPLIKMEHVFYSACPFFVLDSFEAIDAFVLPLLSKIKFFCFNSTLCTMPFAANNAFELVLLVAWTCLCTAPENQKHPIYDKVFPSQAALEQLLSSSLGFAPGLFEAMQAGTPPDLSFFKSLPTVRDFKKHWAVYVVVLEKQGCRGKIYVGSGTEASNGVAVRLANYHNGTLVPRHVAKALSNGYTIVHQGLLCWRPIPINAPVVRMLFVLLEATFTFFFWALLAKTENGYGMIAICPWARHSLEYDGLCSHSPLWEPPVGDHSLTPEELEELAAKMKDRLLESVHRCREKAKKPILKCIMPMQTSLRRHGTRRTPKQ